MKIHRIHSGAGESLVEVTVSAVIFLMMMAVLQGSISFCKGNKAEFDALKYSGTTTIKIKVTRTADGETPGAEAAVLFRIAVELGTKEVTYLDADGTPKTTTFYLFGASDAKGTGEADDVTEDTGGDAP